jgi:hypothetical protein
MPVLSNYEIRRTLRLTISVGFDPPKKEATSFNTGLTVQDLTCLRCRLVTK